MKDGAIATIMGLHRCAFALLFASERPEALSLIDGGAKKNVQLSLSLFEPESSLLQGLLILLLSASAASNRGVLNDMTRLERRGGEVGTLRSDRRKRPRRRGTENLKADARSMSITPFTNTFTNTHTRARFTRGSFFLGHVCALWRGVRNSVHPSGQERRGGRVVVKKKREVGGL